MVDLNFPDATKDLIFPDATKDLIFPPPQTGAGPAPTVVTALVWQSSAGQLLPSDNLDAASCQVVGATDTHGALVGNNKLVKMPFTTAGGKPTNGQTAWLAASQDDANTGRGKATATQPTTSMPAFPLFTQNIVPIGTVVDASKYGVDGTAVVRLSVPTAPIGPSPTNQMFNLRRMTGTTGTDNLTYPSSNATDQNNWSDGETIVIYFTVDNFTPGLANAYILYNYDGTRFWGFNGAASIVIYGDISNPPLNLGNPWPGLNVVVATKTGGNIRASLNGGTVGVNGYASEVTTAGTVTVGGSQGWNRGGITGITKLHRVLSDSDLAKFSNPYAATLTEAAGQPRNFFAPHSQLTADAACQWFIDLTSWTSGTPTVTAGPAGTSFALTKVGNPQSTAFGYTWDQNPAPLYLDGPTPSYDSKHLSRDRQLQRVAYTVDNILDLANLIAGFSLDDTDNGDEGAACVLVNGTPLTNIGSLEDGITRYNPFVAALGGDPIDTVAALGVGPYHVEIVVQDKLTRIDTFDSGGSIASICYPTGAVFDTPVTSKRLIVLGDGQTYAGHSADFGSAAAGTAVLTRVRDDYPGRVTGITCTATMSLALLAGWGNGSVLPYADWLVQQAQEGSPTTRVYLFAFGLMDWMAAFPTSLTTFSSLYGQLLDRVHLKDGSATFALAKPVQTNVYANLNINGDSLQDFADAVGTLTSGRGWLTLIDLTTPNAIAFTGGVGGLAVNPSVASGQAALKANIKAAAVVGYP